MPSGRAARKSIARSLGEFVGHIAHAIRAEPGGPGRRTERLSERTDRKEAADERGRAVILRRTTIDEIEYPDDRG